MKPWRTFLPGLLSVLACLILVFLAVLLSSRIGTPVADTPVRELPGGFFSELSSDCPIFGTGEGRWQVIEFLDYECPFCRKYWPELRALLEHVGPTNISYDIRLFPLKSHLLGRPSAIVAEKARSAGALWEVHRRLLEGGKDLTMEFIRNVSAKYRSGGEVAASDRLLANEHLAERLKVDAIPCLILIDRKLHKLFYCADTRVLAGKIG